MIKKWNQFNEEQTNEEPINKDTIIAEIKETLKNLISKCPQIEDNEIAHIKYDMVQIIGKIENNLYKKIT